MFHNKTCTIQADCYDMGSYWGTWISVQYLIVAYEKFERHELTQRSIKRRLFRDYVPGYCSIIVATTACSPCSWSLISFRSSCHNPASSSTAAAELILLEQKSSFQPDIKAAQHRLLRKLYTTKPTMDQGTFNLLEEIRSYVILSIVSKSLILGGSAIFSRLR